MALIERLYFKDKMIRTRQVPKQEPVVLFRGNNVEGEGTSSVSFKQLKAIGNSIIELLWVYGGIEKSVSFSENDLQARSPKLATQPGRLGFHKEYSLELHARPDYPVYS